MRINVVLLEHFLDTQTVVDLRGISLSSGNKIILANSSAVVLTAPLATRRP